MNRSKQMEPPSSEASVSLGFRRAAEGATWHAKGVECEAVLRRHCAENVRRQWPGIWDDDLLGNRSDCRSSFLKTDVF